ncbi:hypothetical protein GYMLUDRAFT_170445 [Collybiopsis luxurians FD-317 M1]|uniref:Xaa-Pro dipeptidyl-peptidase-like domain-containing protein n=1 Tax=Collybiopsis luxurians FD-317 M1 TaxID=944289 RepID=A0A0D0B679_9AGAR|nr:hypothetical protein GYMLUDRAFT_170445 [Collybiopsis luxurians FD-317 M1]
MSFIRDTVRISSAESGVFLHVWFYKPDGPGPFPVVVAGHGMTVIKEAGLATFGEHWARRTGFASLILDYRYFGESNGQPRDFLSLDYQLQDYKSVIQWAREKPETFRADMIVVMGSAASGHTVARLLLQDPHLAGGMAHCPLLDGYETIMALPFNLRLTVWASLDFIGGKLGFHPVFIPAVGKVGTFAMLNTPSSWSGTLHINRCPPDNNYISMFSQGAKPFLQAPNRVPARYVFDVLKSRAGRELAKAHSRMLIVIAEEDDIFPSSIGRKVAAEAPEKVVLVEAPGGHFDIMEGGRGFEANISAQVEFLQTLLSSR